MSTLLQPINRLNEHWFPDLDPRVRHALGGKWESTSLEVDEVLFQQGDPGDSLYLLQDGSLAVTRTKADGRTVRLQELSPGAIVGEMALVTGLPRNATIHALKPSKLLRLSKASFDRLIEKYPVLLKAFTAWLEPRLQQVQLSGILTTLFGELDVDTLDGIQSQFDWLNLASGDVLFEQGDPGDAMYIVINGRLKVVRTLADGTEQIIGEVGYGEIVGEFALLTQEERTATVYAIRDTNVAKLTADIFEELLAQYPQALMQIVRIIARRGQNITRKASFTSTKVALGFVLIPTESAPNLDEIAHHLTEILSHFGDTLYLNSERFDTLYGRPGAAQIPFDDVTNLTVIDWLNQQERKYQYIVYQADPDWTPWTQRCIRYADRTLLIAQGGHDSRLSLLEKQIREHVKQARVELVLFYDDDTVLPKGTTAWLEKRTVHTHHHVRLHHERDWQRLGRRLVGKAIGLVLGGGGVRSYSQLGAIQVFEEAGIPIDIVGGASMGSIIAATYALEWSLEKKTQVFQLFSSRQKLIDWTLPVVSLLASKKITTLLKEQTGGVNIEDTWIPFFCMSTNTTKAVPVVHKRGEMWRAVRASMSLPTIFSPVLHEGDLLVDGGVMNNLPIDVMLDQMEAGFVIAVSNDTSGEEPEYDFEPDISGWEVVWRRLNPFATPMKVPNMVSHHWQCFAVGCNYHIQSVIDRADLLIEPPVGQFDLLDFAALEPVTKIGYETAQRRLHTWQEEGGQFPPGALFKKG